MHVGKLMARLNPKNVRFDVGQGGLPDLTPQDIAAALAFVPEGLGREMVMRVWWPDGAKLSAIDLDTLIMEAQLEEWMSRARAMLDAQLLEAMATTTHQKRYAKLRIETAKLRMWPRLGGESCYGPIRKAVLAEISAETKCPACQGRAVRLVDRRISVCIDCEGQGHQRVSDRARAEMIGKDHKAYQRVYGKVYEWTFGLCRDAMAPAVEKFMEVVK